MGADLYIKDMPREAQYKGFEVSKEAVDVGYFRDCYNSSGLFAFLTINVGKSFSWWELSTKKEWFTRSQEDGLLMTIKGAKEFLKLILDAKRKVMKKDILFLREWTNDPNEKVTRALTIHDAKEYENWINLLISFLRLAIKNKSQIIWSV